MNRARGVVVAVGALVFLALVVVRPRAAGLAVALPFVPP